MGRVRVRVREGVKMCFIYSMNHFWIEAHVNKRCYESFLRKKSEENGET